MRIGNDWTNTVTRVILKSTKEIKFGHILQYRTVCTIHNSSHIANTIRILNQEFQKDSFTNITSSIEEKMNRKLHLQANNPIGILKNELFSILQTLGFRTFDSFCPIVTAKENFDNLLIPTSHPSRRKCDTFFINEEFLLRTHTTAHDIEALKEYKQNIAIAGDVYRRDSIDKSHFPAFHQLDVVRLFPSSVDHETIIKQLKKDILILIEELLGNKLEYRWIDTYFPFTHSSLEFEVNYSDKWIELLGGGILHDSIVQLAELQNCKAYAFGLGLERLVMLATGIADIRMFWSTDERFLRQYENGRLNPFKPFSSYPHTSRDISFWIRESTFSPNDFYEIVREFGSDLIQDVSLVLLHFA